MSTIAEIEAAVPKLSVEELAELERFVRQARGARLREAVASSPRSFVSQTRDFGFKPRIDLSKLGQS